MFGTQIHERDAYRAVFSFGGTLSGLDPSQVTNIKAANANARAFAAEVVAHAQGQRAGRGQSGCRGRLRCPIRAPAFSPTTMILTSVALPRRWVPINRHRCQRQVKAVAEAARFRSREPAATPEPVAKRIPRRHRTGRNVQFNVKAAQETVDAFYAISDQQNWVLGETLEHALAALQRELAGRAGDRRLMTPRHSLDPQFDLFVPRIADLQLRDQRDTMERPFFSLSKRKRLKPINYVSPDGGLCQRVAQPEYGMATIWDADILIWAASTLNDMKNRGMNDIPRKLHFQPYDLLKAIGRDTGGQRVPALARRPGGFVHHHHHQHPRREGKSERHFSWIEAGPIASTTKTAEQGNEPHRLRLVLRRRPDGGRAAVHRPGLFRHHRGQGALALPRRPQARRRGRGGRLPISCRPSSRSPEPRAPTAASSSRCCQSRRANELPRLPLALEQGEGNVADAAHDPSGTARLQAGAPALEDRLTNRAGRNGRPTIRPFISDFPPARGNACQNPPDFPGWDLRELQALFDGWIGDTPARQPNNSSAFYGFVKRHLHARQHASTRLS